MLKLRRKQEQEKNVERKAEEREAHKQRSLQGMLKAQGAAAEGADNGAGAGAAAGADDDEEAGDSAAPEPAEDDDDDAAYYRQEVGEEPPEGLSRRCGIQPETAVLYFLVLTFFLLPLLALLADLGLGSHGDAAPMKFKKGARPHGFGRKRDGAEAKSGEPGDERQPQSAKRGKHDGGDRRRKDGSNNKREGDGDDERGFKDKFGKGKKGGSGGANKRSAAAPRKLGKRDFRAQAKAKQQSARDKKKNAHRAAMPGSGSAGGGRPRG